MIDKFPKNMNEAKAICRKICKQYKAKISFDDKWNNFGSIYNQSCCGESIDCSKYNDWNYDLLVIAVLHELGHLIGIKKSLHKHKKNRFTHELDAWKWAIDAHIRFFNRNISIRQGEYLTRCLSSYLPDYTNPTINWENKGCRDEREGNFWCPINRQTLKS